MTAGPTGVDVTGLRVLHVVQKYSSGVGSAIAQYTRALPEVEHHLLSGTAVDAEGDLADQADFAGTHRMTGGALAKVRRVREVVRDLRPDVVHAHSSHGGFYARLALPRTAQHLVYTPHCYAFERQDVTAPARAAFWVAEAALALNTSAFAACARREWELSSWPLRRAPRYLVPNVAPAAAPAAGRDPGGAPLVAGGGRLSPQKDPSFFLDTVTRLRADRPDIRAIWLGDGPAEHQQALASGGVEVSGWLPRHEVLRRLSTADVYLHSARWEGFPLMVAEAVALGVPTLVRRVPSFAAVPAQLTVDGSAAAVLACLTDLAAAAENRRGWADLLQHNSPEGQRTALLSVYGRERLPRGSVPAGI